ncbi:uncharacterized protein C2orf50 homolog [Hydractinia symbiolongicarpus]|uniref:uncharacterized protein C2orf50 homolog n=1 Tax=Hydractinia symbiolongicarpus TaxID=13093 RepID=UPI002550E03A|nr:uncharacterized protein C2orf50 homolog [Hydractinia symbiolongicarpus]XP_057309942.1 uncharacterized protein C2orf50 homolog [Hydractinia symbiolongicarpus]
MEYPSQFCNGSRQPQRSYLSSNTLLIRDASSYHEKCIPKETRERIRSAPPKLKNARDYQICNHVAEEMIWEERCKKERSLQKKWENNLSFLAQYDPNGNLKPKKEVSTVVPTVYQVTTTRPLTASREYGHRVNTPPAQTMQRLQQKMTQGLKRNKDLVYYD